MIFIHLSGNALENVTTYIYALFFYRPRHCLLQPEHRARALPYRQYKDIGKQ